MLCAADELGLSDDHEGIMELDGQAVPGTPLAEMFGPPEIVFDLEITPNRPDCLSIIGVAREVAALYGTTLKKPPVEFNESGTAAGERTRVLVEDTKACPRYMVRVIDGVQVGPAPEWMQKRLSLAGIRPINNLVDITNYVLLECGHPLHAFNLPTLAEERIVVRRAKAKEKMTTLDGIERTLDKEVLVIADGKHPVALAGVMGGEGSGIDEGTTTVLLESAYFDPSLIRATSKRYELRSEASYRFERGTDIENVDWASRRVAALMAELAGGQVASGNVDCYAPTETSREINCRWQRVRDLVGVEATDDTIRSVFDALELSTSNVTETDCTVHIPSFRGDLQREVDLVEEFARIHGLDRIPTPAPFGTLVVDADDPHARAVSSLRDILVGLGLNEIINYSLVSRETLDTFDPAHEEVRVALPNPVSQDQAVLRTALWPQMLQTLAGNHAHQCSTMAAFEIGRVYSRVKKKEPVETEMLCIGLLGRVDTAPSTTPVSRTEMFGW
jgi:phenylalanyl-tRNA synthetase beta chain